MGCVEMWPLEKLSMSPMFILQIILPQSVMPRIHGTSKHSKLRHTGVCRELTTALLQQDFGIAWHLQEGQLIPAVTNRVNYIHWIYDLLQLSRPAGSLCACLREEVSNPRAKANLTRIKYLGKLKEWG